MEHASRNGKTYEIGEIKEYGGEKTYEMVAIMDFPTDEQPVRFIDFYFGQYDYETTEHYIQKKEAEAGET